MRAEDALFPEEKISAALRCLFASYGYRRFKPGKFEEYDLYGRNKDFLISEEMITFTDKNGKLMALRPDVTLSIVRSSFPAKGAVQKVFYNERVYRVPKGGSGYKEILQTGLECLGAVDRYAIGEVLFLAAASLCSISEEFVLDVSHLGILEAFVAGVSPDPETEREIFRCAGEKNLHELRAICAEAGVRNEKTETLCRLLSIDGCASDSRDEVISLCRTGAGQAAADAAKDFFDLLSIFAGSPFERRVHVDFSVVSNRAYYNGIVFSGFISGVSDCVLFGGEYDKLMRKMQKNASAIGFAVYLDRLERMLTDAGGRNVDVMLIYGEEDAPKTVLKAVESIRSKGKTVLACAGTGAGAGVRFGVSAHLEKGQVVYDG